MRALAVDNEPEPFWTGDGGDNHMKAWKAMVGWQDDWGEVTLVSDVNGRSGRWVEGSILGAFNVARPDAWITDCLDTYRTSAGMTAVIETIYQPFAAAHSRPRADLESHPTENQIVASAITSQADRLRRHLAEASPRRAVTLGNAALRVFRSLLAEPVGPSKLAADRTYGESIGIRVGDLAAEWFPLAHPAAPPAYQRAHAAWAERRVK